MYLVLEGIDGSGTTVHSKLLAEALKAEWSCRPSQSDLGKLIRATLKSERMHSNESLGHLFVADHLESEVREVLPCEGSLVLDRWITSTFVYQRDVLNWPELVNDVLQWMVCPTAIIYLKIDPEIALRRITERGEPLEKFERLDTLRRMTQNYEDVFALLREVADLPIWTFDTAELSIEEVHKQIMEKVQAVTIQP
ncbi:MAG: dTMP kinase [Candidatus Shapirobacteria bacterium]|jgi:dTMP kinase